MPDTDEERLCLVGLCAAPGVGPASVACLRRAAREQRVPLSEVVALPAEVLEGELGLAPPAARSVAALSGATCAVPAVGVCRFRWRGASSAELAERGWCVLGQFPPDAGWRTAHALMRNRMIAALSDAVVAFDPRDTGGTWHTSLWALRMRKPLFVVGTSREGAKGRGLTHLVRFGAVALDPDRMPDAADFARLVADYRPAAPPDQLPLFDTQGL